MESTIRYIPGRSGRHSVASRLFCAALFALACANSYAVCANGSKTLFSCSTARDKRIEVCESRSMVEYSFGNPQGRAEMVLRVPRTLASSSQWNVAARWNFHALDVPHGDTTYHVFWAGDLQAGTAAQEGGVNVVTGDSVTATVLCVPQSIVQALDSQSLAGN